MNEILASRESICLGTYLLVFYFVPQQVGATISLIPLSDYFKYFLLESNYKICTKA